MEVISWRETGHVPVTILQLKGDLAAEEPLESQARQAFQDGARNMILDLTHVPYISSAGLRAIHLIYMMLREADPDDSAKAALGIARGTYKSPHLKLVNPSRNGRRALTTAGYDMFLDMLDDISTAVAQFQ